MNFKIGQKVVCIKQHSRGILIVGKTYTVLDIIYCSGCGRQVVDIDILLNLPSYGSRCVRCNIIKKGHIWWIASRLFRPVEYDTCHDELLEIIEEKLDTKEKTIA